VKGERLGWNVAPILSRQVGADTKPVWLEQLHDDVVIRAHHCGCVGERTLQLIGDRSVEADHQRAFAACKRTLRPIEHQHRLAGTRSPGHEHTMVLVDTAHVLEVHARLSVQHLPRPLQHLAFVAVERDIGT